jgi:hypothetical protein
MDADGNGGNPGSRAVGKVAGPDFQSGLKQEGMIIKSRMSFVEDDRKDAL